MSMYIPPGRGVLDWLAAMPPAAVLLVGLYTWVTTMVGTLAGIAVERWAAKVRRRNGRP